MPHATERWTAERVRAFPDDGNRYELVSGTLIVTPAPAPRHQAAASALYDRLAPYLRVTGAGTIYWSPADLSLGEDEILQPDLFVFRTPGGDPPERWTDITSLLLAVEILSPGTERYDRGLKRIRYQRAGTPEYWIMDLDARAIERWQPGASVPEVVSDRMMWRPGPHVPVLELDVVDLFAGIRQKE